MRLALCGNLSVAQQIQGALKNSDIVFKFFVREFTDDSSRRIVDTNLPAISFFDFRRLVNIGELDGLLIANIMMNDEFTKFIVQTCKFYGIQRVYVFVDDSQWGGHSFSIYKLDSKKSYIPYIEADLIDGCNLNCKGCGHYANLFGKDEIYPIEKFRRDVRRLSEISDLIVFRLMGGEPLLLENLDEYIKIAREYLPKTNLRVVTNGLLIPSLPQRIFDSIRENNCIVDITLYIPTFKIVDEINSIFHENQISFTMDSSVKKKFVVRLTLNDKNNPVKSCGTCSGRYCRFLCDGKIYKCSFDGLSHRLKEKFGLKIFPVSTGVDIFAPNFSEMLKKLDDVVEMSFWCSEQPRQIPWQPTNNPQLEDWLVDPDELKNFL